MSSKSKHQSISLKGVSAARMRMVVLSFAAMMAVSSLQGCSLLLKSWIHPPEDLGPVDIPSTALLDKVRGEERNHYVLFEDKGGACFKGKLRSLFAIDGKNYAILSTGGTAHDTSYLPVTIEEPRPGLIFFTVLKTREQFETVSKFLMHHRSLVKGNLAKYPAPPVPAPQTEFPLNVDSYTYDAATKTITAICSGVYRTYPYKVKIQIKNDMPPGLYKDGTMDPNCLMQFKAVKFLPMGRESELFVPALGERFQKLVFSPLLNVVTPFGCLPQMDHKFDVLKEPCKLRLLFIEPERSRDYCDIRLNTDLPHKKIVIEIKEPDFQTNFINAVSRELLD